jgi:hypothetical protein
VLLLAFFVLNNYADTVTLDHATISLGEQVPSCKAKYGRTQMNQARHSCLSQSNTAAHLSRRWKNF